MVNLSAEIATLPPGLQQVLRAELDAGNEVVAADHGFPAPPVGVAIRLARPIKWSSELPDVHACRFPNWDSSAGYSDQQRHFFVLGPAPPEPKPTPAVSIPPVVPALPQVDRFRQSMSIDYEKWKDGIGYDLDTIAQADPDERARIEQLLLTRGLDDWRDVEALAQFDSPRARQALQAALRHGSATVRQAVLRYAPQLATDQQRTKAIVEALLHADIYTGLSEALDTAADFHPPEVVEALWQRLERSDSTAAVSIVALLFYLHGQAESRFDWSQRPYFLKFATEDARERKALVQELRERLLPK